MMLNTFRCTTRARWAHTARLFSPSAARQANRAVFFDRPGPGEPASVLYVHTFPDLAPPPANTINVRFLLSPVNPADINVVEGVYTVAYRPQEEGPPCGLQLRLQKNMRSSQQPNGV